MMCCGIGGMVLRSAAFLLKKFNVLLNREGNEL